MNPCRFSIALFLAVSIICGCAYARDTVCTCPDIELFPIDRSKPVKIIPRSEAAAHFPGRPPHYPIEALQQHLEGKSLFEVRLRADGRVSHVKMLQSTGHRVLDEESIQTIQTWNFAYMGKCDRVRIPIIYSLRPRQGFKIVPNNDEPPLTTIEAAQEKQLLLFAALPSMPYEARRSRLSGSGIFDLTFDFERGHLREIHVVKSTGHSMLDGRAIGALELWKAKPRSIHTLRVPINFPLTPLLKE
jgi:TonB family protein